jgi:hypothetical protein
MSFRTTALLVAHAVIDPQAGGTRMRLHPVHTAPGAADKRALAE